MSTTMTESPAAIAQYVVPSSSCAVSSYLLHSPREAKSTHQSLKELIKSRDIFDRDVDLQRKKQVLPLIPPFHHADNINQAFEDYI